MNTLFTDFSLFVYQNYAKKHLPRLKEIEWNSATMTREMDSIKEETVYIGNDIKDLYWLNYGKKKKKHLCLRIVKRSEDNGEDLFEIFIDTNVLSKEEQKNIVMDFVEYLKNKGMDELIHYPDAPTYKKNSFDKEDHLYPTGKRSEELVKLLKSIEFISGMDHVNIRDQTFRLYHNSNEYQIKLSPKNQSLRIITNDELIVSIKNEEELKNWFKQERIEQHKILEVYQKAINIFRERTKVHATINGYGNFIIKGKKEIKILFTISKKTKNGKDVFIIFFNDKEYTTSSYEKIEKKSEEIVTRFANEYRVRHLVGQK